MVRNNTIKNALLNVSSIDENMVTNLNQIIKKYPYFSSAHILLSKGLKNIDSIRFNHKIKIAAAYSTNRKVLFNIIISSIGVSLGLITYFKLVSQEKRRIGGRINAKVFL